MKLITSLAGPHNTNDIENVAGSKVMCYVMLADVGIVSQR